jgi:hypothetical protein
MTAKFWSWSRRAALGAILVTPSLAHAETAQPRAIYIGLHIGGGPNDAASKAPIERSVAPHLDELATCAAHLENFKGGDFGVDLRIPREGGRASVTHPRTAITDGSFRACVVNVFEAIEFERPKTGTTNASYSVRFTAAR